MPTPNRPYYPKQKLLLPPDLLPLARSRRAPEASKKKGIIYKSPETQALTTVPGLSDPPGFDGTEDCPRQLGHSI